VAQLYPRALCSSGTSGVPLLVPSYHRLQQCLIIMTLRRSCKNVIRSPTAAQQWGPFNPMFAKNVTDMGGPIRCSSLALECEERFENFGEGNGCPGRHCNPRPNEYEVVMLTRTQRRDIRS
jgi:hypothetical protein